ncbi:uncharacterized protein [Clytia hemisphaerica]|uniref:uncharacterized protein n=1 Tax=Clytia hemisphaerica TaxID=252671 RepID=UPI0034D42441
MVSNTGLLVFHVLFGHALASDVPADLNVDRKTDTVCSQVPELTFDDVINDVMVLEDPIRLFHLDNTWSCLKECMKMFPLCNAINLNPERSICNVFMVQGEPVFRYEKGSIYYGVKRQSEVCTTLEQSPSTTDRTHRASRHTHLVTQVPPIINTTQPTLNHTTESPKELNKNITNIGGHRCIWFNEPKRVKDLVNPFRVYSRKECAEKCFQKMTQKVIIYGATLTNTMYCYCNYKPNWQKPYNINNYRSCYREGSGNDVAGTG